MRRNIYILTVIIAASLIFGAWCLEAHAATSIGFTFDEKSDAETTDVSSVAEAAVEDVPVAVAAPPAIEAVPASPVEFPLVEVIEEVAAPEVATDEAVTYDVGPAFETMAQAEILFIGRLTAAQMGPTAMSMPPIYNVHMTFQVTDSLRGGVESDESVRDGEFVQLSYQARQNDPPQFDVDIDYVVTGKRDSRTSIIVVTSVEPASVGLLADAELAGAIPIGWRVEDGDLLGPWALMDGAWPAGAVSESGLACAVTGRPALLAGAGISLTSEKVPPAEEIEWTNPDGDGEYTITVTNTTDEAIDVPALLSDESGILWEESLVVICQGKVQACPGARGVTTKTFATVLQPGESVSGVVNAFGLTGIEWPRGGYRVEFTFCLGELAVTESFYYKSDHHDAIRLGDDAPAE